MRKETKRTNRKQTLNYNVIIDKFDVIEEVIIQPNGTSIRVRGTKNGEFADCYADYNYKQVAKAVYDKVNSLIGMKG